MSAEILLGTDWYVDIRYQEPPTYTITAAEYVTHLRNERILQALMEVGVHTHERFDEAMIMARAEEDE